MPHNNRQRWTKERDTGDFTSPTAYIATTPIPWRAWMVAHADEYPTRTLLCANVQRQFGVPSHTAEVWWNQTVTKRWPAFRSVPGRRASRVRTTPTLPASLPVAHAPRTADDSVDDDETMVTILRIAEKWEALNAAYAHEKQMRAAAETEVTTLRHELATKDAEIRELRETTKDAQFVIERWRDFNKAMVTLDGHDHVIDIHRGIK